MGEDAKYIVDVILKITTIVLPWTVAVLGVTKKKFFKKQFQQMKVRMEDGFNDNINQHKAISKILQDHTECIQNHTQSITRILQQKTIAQRLRQISKHAVCYCGNRTFGKIIDRLIQEFIVFVQDITDIGFQNTNRQQILAKISIARDNSNNFARHIVQDSQ